MRTKKKIKERIHLFWTALKIQMKIHLIIYPKLN